MGSLLRHDTTRVLVVEAAAIPALDLRRSLKASGCAVLCPVTTAAGAIRVLRHERPDLAVLGTALQDGSPLPVAQQLLSADVPFALFASNDDRMLEHPMLRAAALLPKPYTPPQLRLLVHRLVLTTVLTSLHRTERRVGQAWHAITTQARVINRLAQSGHDTRLAEELLMTYERTLAILQEQQERLMRELARQDSNVTLFGGGSFPCMNEGAGRQGAEPARRHDLPPACGDDHEEAGAAPGGRAPLLAEPGLS